MPASPIDYDGFYRRLFSHPEVVAQLLRSFVDGPWIKDLDLDAMERLNTKFHADTGERRESDLIWRIPRRDGHDTYLVLLLEFQTKAYRYMAVRVLTYASLLWEQLLREDRLPAKAPLPPLLPVVIYNGDTRWRMPRTVRALIGLPDSSALWRYQPDLRYHLIDAGAFSQAALQQRDNLPALWFRLETASDPAGVAAVAEAVIAWFARHPGYATARSVFAAYLSALTASPDSGPTVPEELQEVRDMLATRVQQWQQNWLLEGRQDGMQKGEAAMLLRLLERRFGPLSDDVTGRIRAAGTGLLEEWGLRTLDATSLDDVFADRQPTSAPGTPVVIRPSMRRPR